MKKQLLFFVFLWASFALFAQNTDKSTNEKIKIFLDCTRPWLCDVDFLKNEFKMVDYVRDRFASDVHVILNTQFSAGSGEQNELVCLGQGRFINKNDTLRYFNDGTSTDDEKRQKLLKFLRLGLMSYIAHSSIADKIEFTYKDDKKDDKVAANKKDPWNNWQFSVNTSGFIDVRRLIVFVAIKKARCIDRKQPIVPRVFLLFGGFVFFFFVFVRKFDFVSNRRVRDVTHQPKSKKFQQFLAFFIVR